ncbi:cell division ABC transporter permease protein [Coprobacillus sp. CAG:605]|nr:cell division ABC transporter permease protein [Coprobacillus sp. CAG:605]
MKIIRIFVRNVRDAFRSVVRNFSLSLAAITCITITLILVALSMVITANVNNFTKTLEDELSIVVYLNEDVSTETENEIYSNISGLDGVEKATLKTKEEWKKEIQSYSSELDATLSYLEDNPLLDSVIVKVKDINSISYVASIIRNYDGVKSAQYGEETVDKMIAIFDIVKKATVVVVLALILVTAFLISNTIKLTIFSRKSEIEIMRLVGTSNFVIKQPFIIEGFFLGLIGSVIPIIVTIYGYILFYDHFDGYLFSHLIELIKPMSLVWYISGVLAILGGIVGMFGSGRAVRKYLKI